MRLSLKLNSLGQLGFGVLFLLISVGVLFGSTPLSSALSGSDFKPGRIIDDSLFFNGDTMTASQIQSFLDSKVPNCDTDGSKNYSYHFRANPFRLNNSDDPIVTTSRAIYGNRYYQANGGANGSRAPFTCINDYVQDTPFKAGESGLCAPITAKVKQTAAQIIDTVAKACSVSEKVLIVMLQKEQGLITDDWPWGVQYTKAMGYYCPDDPDRPGWCHPDYAGFFNQVYNAALQFQRYKASPNNWNHVPFTTNNILYQANRPSCGTRSVYIENYATAGLYNYTPYTPNTAALNNLYGTGDICSAYGNRNFWRYYNDWFGSPTKPLVHTRLYDSTTDKTGERATIGIWLDRRPTASVTIPIHIYSPSNGRIVGNHTSITISPEWWDWPEKNIVKIAGKDNPHLVGTMENKLVFGRATSQDKYYDGVNLVESSVTYLHQDSTGPPSVFRLYSSGRHFFTTSTAERGAMINNGWIDEGSPISYCYNGNQTVIRLKKDDDHRLAIPGTAAYSAALEDGFSFDSIALTGSSLGNTPVYWRYNENNGNSLYTTSETEGLSGGYIDKGIVFTACDKDAQTTYRLYRPSAGNYFLTHSAHERDRAVNSLGYVYEGTSFYTCGGSGNVPIHRLYNDNLRKHLYTASSAERDKTVARNSGWKYEGVAFSVCSDGSRPVYRLHKPSLRKYLYTASEGEANKAATTGGYTNEGVVFTVQ